MTISPDQIRLLREWMSRKSTRRQRNQAGFLRYWQEVTRRGLHSPEEGLTHPCHKSRSK